VQRLGGVFGIPVDVKQAATHAPTTAEELQLFTNDTGAERYH
jgi:hypothetical protein